MKVALFYPPVGNLCQPYLSLPALVAYLKENGVTDVTQYDFNIEVLDELLSPERLSRSYRWIYHFLNEHRAASSPNQLDLMKLTLAQHALPKAQQTIERIDAAKQVFRSDQMYDSRRYGEALQTINDAFELLSARYFPTVISNQGFAMRYRLDSSDDILAGVHDEDENCFIEILRKHVRAVFRRDGVPDVAGVSIGFYEQLIPGLTLARLVKEASPSTHITIGGTMMSALVDKPFAPAFFALLDSIVFFEGEIPLLRLVQALEQGVDLRNVPNLLFMHNGEQFRTPILSKPLGLDAIPVPDFNDLALTRYLSPEPILPLAGSRGCYWGKCTFCTRQHFIETYRKHSTDRIIEDIKSLQASHGANAFFFGDECFAPSTLNALADRILVEGLDISWSCYVRFEKQLADPVLCKKLAASGLKMFFFGLESACQRVIDLMKKGTEKAVIGQILETTASVGIQNMILYFVGFPTETREEAIESMQFLLDHQDQVKFAIAGQFLLEESSPIYENPTAFAITEASPLSTGSDLGIIYDYKTSTGMSATEAAKIKDLINDRTGGLHRADFLNRSHLLLIRDDETKPVRSHPG